jgi:hypothetical protein
MPFRAACLNAASIGGGVAETGAGRRTVPRKR